MPLIRPSMGRPLSATSARSVYTVLGQLSTRRAYAGGDADGVGPGPIQHRGPPDAGSDQGLRRGDGQTEKQHDLSRPLSPLWARVLAVLLDISIHAPARGRRGERHRDGIAILISTNAPAGRLRGMVGAVNQRQISIPVPARGVTLGLYPLQENSYFDPRPP